MSRSPDSGNNVSDEEFDVGDESGKLSSEVKHIPSIPIYVH